MIEGERQKLAIKLEIPQQGSIELQHAVFDINGTLAIDGVIIPGVAERLQAISSHISIHILTAGTHGNLPDLERTLGFPLHLINKGDEKMRYVQDLGPQSVIAFGNGVNDNQMLRLAKIGVIVLTPEGISTRALQNADVMVYGSTSALDLLLKPNRLIATLRG
jgi:soluble P-type ATPase